MTLYQAGDDTTGVSHVWQTVFTEHDWLLDAIQQALGSLSVQDNWTGSTAFTPQQAADLAQGAIDTFMPTLDRIGMISAYAGDLVVPPPGALLCDGASYLRADYLDLFAVIGSTYGAADSTHFNVPNLEMIVIAGVDTVTHLADWQLGVVHGETDHTLDVAETPSHTHTDIGHTHLESGATATTFTVGPGAPVPSAFAFPTVTGAGNASLTNTGGDASHNNVQPTMALYYVIQAVHG